MPENKSIHREEFVIGEKEYTITFLDQSEKKDVRRTQAGHCPSCGNPIDVEWVPTTCYKIICIKDPDNNKIDLESELGIEIATEITGLFAEIRTISSCPNLNCQEDAADEEPFESEEEQSEEPE